MKIAVVGYHNLPWLIKWDCGNFVDVFDTDEKLLSIEKSDYDKIVLLKGTIFQADFLSDVKEKVILWYPDNIDRFRDEFNYVRETCAGKTFLANYEYTNEFSFMPFGCSKAYIGYNPRKDIDILFYGTNNNPTRFEWVMSLKKYFGDLLYIVGNGWPEGIAYSQALYYNDMFNLLSRAKLTINMHYNNTGPNMRVFETLGAGSHIITDDVNFPRKLLTNIYYGQYPYSDYDTMIETLELAYRLTSKEETQEYLKNNCKIIMLEHRYIYRIEEMCN